MMKMNIYKSILGWGMLFSCSIVADEFPLILHNEEGVAFEVEYDDEAGENQVWLRCDECDCALIGYFLGRRSEAWQGIQIFYRYMFLDDNTKRTDFFLL